MARLNQGSRVGIGLAIGVAVGVALGNIALGIALGLVFGAGASRINRSEKPEDHTDDNEG